MDYKRAAILINLLGQEVAHKIFSNLKDSEVKIILKYMNKITKVSVHEAKDVLEEYYEQLSEKDDFVFDKQNLLEKVLGKERAEQLFGKNYELNKNELEALELVDDRTLINYLQTEHPQTTALIISFLSVERKTNVLNGLPEPLKAEIVVRTANMDHVNPEYLKQLDETLKRELSKMGTMMGENLKGGPSEVAEMLNNMSADKAEALLNMIGDKDPELVEEIRNLMFVFDDLVLVDDKGIQEILKCIDNQVLTKALKNANEDVLNKFYTNMSSRAAKIMKEDISSMPKIKLSDVESSQQQVLSKCKHLQSEGKLTINRGGEADKYV
jgi:flagellar motor switch protein FliG